MTDTNKYFRPHIHMEECLGTRAWFEFNSYKVLDQDETALRANPNPFALIILTTLLSIKNKKEGDLQLLKIKRELLREMLARNLDGATRRAVFNFLNYFVHFKSKEAKQTFEQDIQQITERNITMGTEEYLLDKARNQGIETGLAKGIERGIEQGRREGKEHVVKNLITQLGLTDEQVAGVAEVSVEFVKHIRRHLSK